MTATVGSINQTSRTSRCFVANFENSVQSIETSINKYFQLVTLSSSFDLSKIIDVSRELECFAII